MIIYHSGGPWKAEDNVEFLLRDVYEDNGMIIYYSGDSNGEANPEQALASVGANIMLSFHYLHNAKTHWSRLEVILEERKHAKKKTRRKRKDTNRKGRTVKGARGRNSRSK